MQTVASREMVTMQRCTMIVQRHVPIAQRNPTTVQRVQTIVLLRYAYRLLRGPDSDRGLDKASARSDEAIARSADRTLRSSRSGLAGETICTRASEPSGANRGSDLSDDGSLRAIRLHDCVIVRSCTTARRGSRSSRRSSATNNASVALHAESPTRSGSFDAMVTPIAALGEAKRHDDNTHRVTRNGDRTARELNRTAQRIDAISRCADQTVA